MSQIAKTNSLSIITKALSLSPEPLQGFKAEDWAFVNSDNICLTDGESCAFFEKDSDGSFYGHWFFFKKGKEAKQLAALCLDYMFKVTSVIKGLTPLENREAQYMARHMGFKSYGNVETQAGDMVLFIQTRQEWLNHIQEWESK